MNVDDIVYRDGMPFYGVTRPLSQADGIVVEDLRIQDIVSYINKKHVKSAYVWHVDNYEWIRQCPSLENVELEFNLLMKHWSGLPRKGKKMIKEYDVSPIYELPRLKYLSLVDCEIPIIINQMELDLSKLNKLQAFFGEYKYIKNLGQAYSLKTLWILRYDATDMNPLKDLTLLDTATFVWGNMETLNGIENLPKMQCLSLRSLRRLTDISSLEKCKDSLKYLNIESCVRIEDFSILGKLKKLESLFIDCNIEIPSLQFINDLPNLKSFFCTANILDGDLTPCLRLQRVKFPTIKRHYNLKKSELPYDDGIEPFGMDNIEEWRRLYI